MPSRKVIAFPTKFRVIRIGVLLLQAGILEPNPTEKKKLELKTRKTREEKNQLLDGISKGSIEG